MLTRFVLAMAACAAISGCSATATPSTPDAGAPPQNYRAAAAENVKSTFFDPYTVRDASISLPLYAPAVFDGITPIPRKGWIVCVRANAKNRMGGYIGQQTTVMLFKGESVDFALSGPDYQGQIADDCKTAVYSQFPEIEQKT